MKQLAALLATALLATACTRAASQGAPGAPTLMKTGETRRWPGTDLTVHLERASLPETDKGHVLVVELLLSRDGQSAPFELVDDEAAVWQGYKVEADAEGFGWSDPGATISVSRVP